MTGDRHVNHGLGGIAKEIESVAFVAAQELSISDDDLGDVLSFLTKVSHVVEQAFRDVLVILIDIKLLRPQDVDSSKIYDLQRRIEFVMARSHYRDAEEICSRLKYLKDIYLSELDRLIDPLPGRQGWSGLFGLIEEREGRIMMLIREVLWNLGKKLDTLNERNLPQLTAFATDQAQSIKKDLNTLGDFTNQCLGLSGRRGLLELVRDPGNRAAAIQRMSVLVNHGNIDMSKIYSSGQSGGVNISGSVGSIHGDIIGGDQTIGAPCMAKLDDALGPLLEAIRTAPAPAEKRSRAEAKLVTLKQEAAKGEKANDGLIAKLIDGMIDLVPGAVSAVVGAFATPILSGAAGPVTKFVLDKLKV